MEEIVGVVVEEINVLSWKVFRSFTEWKLVLSEPLDIHWKLDVSSLNFAVVINLSVLILEI